MGVQDLGHPLFIREECLICGRISRIFVWHWNINITIVAPRNYRDAQK
jgi:hypothetical protein